MKKTWTKNTPMSIRMDERYSNHPVLIQDPTGEGLGFNYTSLFSHFKEKMSKRRSPKNIRTAKQSLYTNLSSFTVHENTITNDKMERLSTLERTGKKYAEKQKILSQDCRELLRTANREIKNISYQLSTVISDGEYHVKLMAMYPEELEVLEETCMYCKVECKGMLAPAKFSVGYKSKGDLVVYTSYRHSLPSKSRCDNVFKLPRKFLLFPKDKSKVFANDHIYLCLYSVKGVAVQLEVKFRQQEEEDMSPKSKAIANTANLQQNEILKKFFNMDFEQSPTQDIVQENKKRVFFWPDIKSRKMEMRRSVFIDRARQCQKLKKKLLVEHIKKSKMYLNRWEILRKKRFEQEKIQRKLDLK